MLDTETPTTMSHEERAYRRGCHQAVAALADMATEQRLPLPMRQWIKRAEDILCEMREDPEPLPGFIHEFMRRLGT